MMTLSPYFIHRVNGERQTARSRSGSALVIVLGMLSVLLLMGVAFSVTMRTERSGAANMRHAAMARHILDSAIARTMSDLDAVLREDGDLPVPEDLVVAVSGTGKSDLVVNVLSHEASRHLPGDQLAAALYANAEWRPIYGDVRISTTSDQDPTSEDAPVGRYAYVILNGCGNLDPNVVGATNRFFGMTPSEIDIEGTGGRVLGEDGAGTATAFIRKRDANGHYATMRDFLRPEIIKDILHYKDLNATSSKPTFPTNSFTVGSMAVDDLTPSTGMDDGGGGSKNYPKVHKRLPKFPLVDDSGAPIMPKDLSDDEMEMIAEYFGYALSATQNFRGDDALPTSFSVNKKNMPYHVLVARNLMDALDEDNIPGGSERHKLEHINRGGAADRYDDYASRMTGTKRDWEKFPCTEPVPMLDNFILVAGEGNKPGLELELQKGPGEDGTPNAGPVTNVLATLRVSFYQNSAIYPGWNLPEGAAGEYGYTWLFSGSVDNHNYGPGDVSEDFQTDFEAKSKKVTLAEQFVKGSFKLEKMANGEPRLRSPGDLVPAFSFKFSISNAKTVEEALEKIPDDFGFQVHITGFLYKSDDLDNDVRQVAPCFSGNDNVDSIGEDSCLDVDLWFHKEYLTETTYAPEGDNPHIVAGMYCIDPMFAYEKESWFCSKSPDMKAETSPHAKIRENITFHLESDFAKYETSINPLTSLYLENPRKKIGNSTVFRELNKGYQDGIRPGLVGGGCDVMWANPDDSKGDSAQNAAKAFFIDPLDTDPDSPYAFTRVGQLGFLPIGTHRTIALLDGWGTSGGGTERVPRQRVLDYFTMHIPRDFGTSGSGGKSGKPVKAALFTSRVNINPPRTAAWRTKTGDGKTTFSLETDDFNPLPLTAVLNGCPLREWAGENSRMPVSWELAEKITDGFLMAIDIDKGDVIDAVEEEPSGWNAEGIVHDISVLGRCVPDDPDESIDVLIRKETKATCDFDREGIIRNTAEMLTARQQIFTILLKADSFTPKFGYNDAEHGTSLASVHAIAHVWRDPEPLRDADGLAVRDRDGNPIYPWVLLDMYQF